MSTWNEKLDKALLVALMDPLLQVSRPQFEDAANRLGNGSSWNACRQRFYKLKAEAATLHTEGAAPTTPKKSIASPRGGSKTPAAGSVKKHKANADESARKRNKNSTVKKEPESEEAEGESVSVNESDVKLAPEQNEGRSVVFENTEEGEQDELENIALIDGD